MVRRPRPTRDETNRVPVALPREETAPEGWLRNLRFSGFTLLMLGLIVFAVAVLAPNLRILIEQRAQIAELQESVGQASESVADLTEEVARWDDPAYIESQARERLYYVFPGDVSYLVVGEPVEGGAQSVGGLPISDRLQETRTDWVAGLLSSLYTAGLTQATPDELETTP